MGTRLMGGASIWEVDDGTVECEVKQEMGRERERRRVVGEGCTLDAVVGMLAAIFRAGESGAAGLGRSHQHQSDATRGLCAAS